MPGHDLGRQPWLGLGGLLLATVVFFALAAGAGGAAASRWQPAAIGAACGCIISAALIVAILFEGWPAARLPPAAGRALPLTLTALTALALDRALASYADRVRWTRVTPDQWVITAALGYAAVGILLHVGIGLRWPFAADRHGPPS